MNKVILTKEEMNSIKASIYEMLHTLKISRSVFLEKAQNPNYRDLDRYLGSARECKEQIELLQGAIDKLESAKIFEVESKQNDSKSQTSGIK